MNEKSPSITFQNRINNIKEGYEELGNLTIKSPLQVLLVFYLIYLLLHISKLML